MHQIPKEDILKRIAFENPWWTDSSILDRFLEKMRDRSYLAPFFELVTNRDVRRAVVLMGPRRVGKTVMLRQTIRKLIHERNVPPKRILFASLESPIYTQLDPTGILNLFMEENGHDRFADLWVIFDEIQYANQWEAHLKTMVDDYPNIRFVVSGSAAAALRMKSAESGAGRFTDFLLPPLLFAEFLEFTNAPEEEDITELNKRFVDYINYGGFPEAIENEAIRKDMYTFIAQDIIEKVLRRDLPSLYGIDDPNELNRFFANLVYNTGQEVSIGKLSEETNIPKNTLYKYFTFLEAAFLIHRLYRVDQHGKRPKREMGFKVYVTNPSLRAAMFGPVSDDCEWMGALVETAFVAQLIHSNIVDHFYYARWEHGEVDLVFCYSAGGIGGAYEIKWTNKPEINRTVKKNLIYISKENGLDHCWITTKSAKGNENNNGIRTHIVPASQLCRNFSTDLVSKNLKNGSLRRRLLPDPLPEIK